MPLLPLHQAHDPRALLTRWRAVAHATGMRVRVLTEVAGEKILYLESTKRPADTLWDYLSTGVHGDEAGSAWGLLAWAEGNLVALKQGSFVIFPCLNPLGLRDNTRLDHRGLDINRRFHLDDDAISGPWRKMISSRLWSVGLCLHEDYDSQGCYVYELGKHRRTLSSQILAECTQLIALDPRRSIDDRPARAGIIRRSTIPADLPGMPEAIVLYQLGCPITLTFETPSEFDLETRVQTQAAFVKAALHHAAQP
ncbi:MAG: M14 family metallocarboxypeptidase [Prosthecobacter sp.]